MRQINAAYEQIKTQKTGGASYERPDGSYGPQQQHQPGGGYTHRGDDPFGGFDFGGFGDLFGDLFGQAWEQQQNNEQQDFGVPMMQQARLYIQIRQYQTALRVLSQISERDAQWYYLSGIANAGIGNRVTALNHAKKPWEWNPAMRNTNSCWTSSSRAASYTGKLGKTKGLTCRGWVAACCQIMLAQMVCLYCCQCC